MKKKVYRFEFSMELNINKRARYSQSIWLIKYKVKLIFIIFKPKLHADHNYILFLNNNETAPNITCKNERNKK